MKKADEYRIDIAEKALDKIHKKCCQKNKQARIHLEQKYKEAEDADNPSLWSWDALSNIFSTL